MIEKIFKPVKISKENFDNYGDLISTNNVKKKREKKKKVCKNALKKIK